MRRVFWIGVMVSHAAAIGAPGIVRGIYCRPGAALDNRVWRPYGRGFVADSRTAHSGRVSLRCANADASEAHGAGQFVEFNQPKARPIVIAGWAKLQGVSGRPSYKCSVYLDLRLRNGKSWPMKVAVFDPAKKGWQYAERVYVPPAAVRSARVYVFLREKAGTAWFDDIYVGEVLDAKGTRSKNLLRAPGFERMNLVDERERENFFKQLAAIGCNAFHFYAGVPWEKAAVAELPALSADDPLPGFVRAAHERGFKVWLTVGLRWPALKTLPPPDQRLYACVNGPWGRAYTRAVAYLAQSGVDGVGVVPDEWTWTTGRIKRVYSKSRNPEVAAFYKALPAYCHCPRCQAAFRKRYGVPLPDVTKLWATNDPVWARFVEFRYACTAAWMQRTVAAAKRVNPRVVTDTMICVLPVCSDDRIGAGAAWDLIGAATQLDCLQTDPYIFLHNYKGDSTHWYATETAIHLASANWRRRAGVTLEACRLRAKYREKDPAEVYGAALSCLAHGAREFFWWHMTYILGRRDYVNGPRAGRRVAAAYQVMREMEPYLIDAASPGDVLVLYSRRSEDTWARWAKGGLDPLHRLPQTPGKKAAATNGPAHKRLDPRRGFIAHKNALYWLLRRGYPFQMTYLEHPNPAALAAAKAVVVPFPLALARGEAARLKRLAEDGATVVVLSELSPVDELGQPLTRPRLAETFGLPAAAAKTESRTIVKLGRGRVVFFPGDSAIELFEPVEPMKDPKGRVPLAAFNAKRTAALERTISDALGRPGSVFRKQPAGDVEATLLKGPAGPVLLTINWETKKPADIAFQPTLLRSRSRAEGWRIDAQANVHKVAEPLSPTWTLRLNPQEAALLRLR